MGMALKIKIILLERNMTIKELAEKLGGDIEAAIQQLACKRETKTES